MSVKLFPFQEKALKEVEDYPSCAFYLDMGLGKTFTGSEKLVDINNDYNVLICQNSKVPDWIQHFKENYDLNVIDYTKPKAKIDKGIIIITYGLIWRRKEFMKMENFTLMLDESSEIQNSINGTKKVKKTTFITRMLKPKNIILLSGTPTDGKYEKLYTQLRMLGLDMSETEYWNRFVIWREMVVSKGAYPKKIKIVTGYKNVPELKALMKVLGCVFLKTEDVMDLPEQVDIIKEIPAIPEYKQFSKHRITEIDNTVMIGDTPLKRRLYKRQLSGMYNKHKYNNN